MLNVRSLLVLLLLAAFAVPARAQSASSRLLRTVSLTLDGRANYRSPALRQLSLTGGEAALDPLVDVLGEDLARLQVSIDDFENVLSDHERREWLEGISDRAVARADERARALAARIQKGLAAGEEPEPLRQAAGQALHDLAAYLGHGSAYHQLFAARQAAWKAVQLRLAAAGAGTAEALSIDKTDNLNAGSSASPAASAASPARRAPLKYSHGYFLEQLTPEMTATISRPVRAADIQGFADASGDDQDIHTNPAAAEDSILGGPGPIAHGVLTLGYVSAVLGTKLPGPGTIFSGLDRIRFKRPVRAGDEAVTTVKIVSVESQTKPIPLPKPRNGKTHVLAGAVHLEFTTAVKGKPVLSGEATVFVESKDQTAAPPAPPAPQPS